MNFNFKQALDKFIATPAKAFKALREGILPTPGKRKREPEAPEEMQEDRPAKRGPAVEDPGGGAPLQADSQFATVPEPLTRELSEVTKLPEEAPRQWATPAAQGGWQPRNPIPGMSAYRDAGTVDRGRTGRGEGRGWQASVSRPANEGAAAPVALFQQRQLPPGMRTPWQERYPDFYSPKPSNRDARATGAQGGANGLPFTTFAAKPSPKGLGLLAGVGRQKQGINQRRGPGRSFFSRQRFKVRTQDWEDREVLRKAIASQEAVVPPQAVGVGPSAVIDLEAPSQAPSPQPLAHAHSVSHALAPPESARDPVPGILDLAGPSRLPNPSLQRRRGDGAEGWATSVARYEQVQRLESAPSEQLKREVDESLAVCGELMGDRQRDLLARSERVLAGREGSGRGRSSAAEISKASMEAARRQAAAIAAEDSEMELLERQQALLRERREARMQTMLAAQSAAKPAQKSLPSLQQDELPAVAKGRPAVADGVVDLLSSDDEGAEDGDEAATSHGGATQEDGSLGEASYTDEAEDDDEEEESEEDEEEEVRGRLLDVSVSDARPPPGFSKLTRHQRAQYADALDEDADRYTELKLHKSSNIGITRDLMMCLRAGQWLNDEVINLTMGLLQDRDKKWRPLKKYPKCHFFNTFFFGKLYLDMKKYDYSAVSRWTRPKRLQTVGQESASILDCDRIIAPVHLGVHWTCAMADLANKRFVYLDSMGEKNHKVMASLQKYVADEYRDKRKEEVDTSKWPIVFPPEVPVQTNGYDCGVFALTFAEHLSRDASLSFSQKDIRYFRATFAAAIMDLSLQSEF